MGFYRLRRAITACGIETLTSSSGKALISSSDCAEPLLLAVLKHMIDDLGITAVDFFVIAQSHYCLRY